MNLAIRPKSKPSEEAVDKGGTPPRATRAGETRGRTWAREDETFDDQPLLPLEIAAAHEEEPPAKAVLKKRVIGGCLFPVCVIFWLLLVVVWDMRKVQQLSTIIHNDHASLWEDMNESAIARAYSPMSLCILDAPPSTLNSVEIRTSCADLNQKDRFPFCTVGYSFNKECLGSLLSEDSYYFKTLRDPYFHDAHDKLLLAMERLARAGWALVFVGDKVALQSMNALICALEGRRGPHFQIYQNSVSNFTVKWISSSAHQLEINFQTLRAIRYTSGDDKHISGEAINNFNRLNGSSTTLEITQAKIASVLQRFQGVVVVANVGSYYNNRVSFREDMPSLMTYLDELGRHNIAIFRESASQHWNLTRSGYYSVQNRRKGSKVEAVSCMPNLDSTPSLDWRNRDAESTVTTYGLENIDWIYFHDITAPLYNMHPYGLNSSSPADVDCTQYCYFPQMWEPIWMQLHGIIDNNEKLITQYEAGNRNLRVGDKN